jgi:hypothetical protein
MEKPMLSATRKLLCAIAALAILLGAPNSVFAVQDPPLTNEAIISLCKVGLGDDVVVAKIKQAAAVTFKLDTKALINLKEQGVSSAVVKAMLERTTPAQPAATSPADYPSQAEVAYSLTAGNPKLSTPAGDVVLERTMGSYGMSGFGAFKYKHLDFPGFRSTVRTKEQALSILVKSEMDPSNSDELTIVKLDVDERGKTRSFLFNHGGTFSRTSKYIPESNCVVPFTSKAVRPGLFRLSPVKPLEPGEYGVFNGHISVFDFGVDG